ncbi:cation transporter [Verrucomicrobiales bacterium BCK34]|nr:cation transporter [Verrucomicrobiales bacterium BCK34]
MSECDCNKASEEIQERSVLGILLAINGLMFLVEIVLGVLADSTSLVADSLDMLADATVYGIAFYAVGRASSVKLKAARLSGWFQILLAAGVFADILRRFFFGSNPDFWFMLGVGVAALIANVICLVILSKHRKGEVHMRASWIFSKNDVIANVGILIAGALVYFTQTRWPDLIIGLIITIVVLRGGLQILKDASSNKDCDSE